MKSHKKDKIYSVVARGGKPHDYAKRMKAVLRYRLRRLDVVGDLVFVLLVFGVDLFEFVRFDVLRAVF